LYLGSYNNATNKKELDYANIKYILNCAEECRNLFDKDFIYMKLHLSDNLDSTIIDLFEQSMNFIEEAKKNNCNIFIHCQIGKSRSATIVLAYIMKTMKLSCDDAFKFVKNIRRMILPNLGFMRQLREYEKQLNTI
jgi:dual specificity MAP kinase phosphatase